jgi:NitT/TauT family transport system substrate-binding protein
MNLSRKISRCFFALLICALAGYFGTPSRALAEEPLKLKLVLPTAVTTFMLPYLVPAAQGWYKQNGLEVEETLVAGDSTALRSVIAGTGDITIIGPLTVFEAVISGAQLKVIGSWQPIVDYRIVAAKSVGSTLADLKNKTFASAGPSDMTTELPKMVLRKHGIDEKGLKFIQVGGHPARLQAVVAGKVDAALINTLTSVKGESEGAVTVVSKITDDFPSFGYVSLTVKAADLSDPTKRKAFEIFLRGNVLGARYTMEHPQEAAEILQKRAPDLDLALIKRVVQELNGMKVWGLNGGNDGQVLTFTSDTAFELKMIDRKVKLEEVMDNSIQDKLLAELGKR